MALQEASPFAFGGVGEAGVTSDGEAALRAVLASTNAHRDINLVLLNGGTPGRLYALCAIHKLWPEEFGHALQMVDPNAKLWTMSGCILQEQSASEILRGISSGDYDAYIAKDGT